MAQKSQNRQETTKGSYQTARMHRLVGAFAGRTYHIAGILMSWLIFNIQYLVYINPLYEWIPPSYLIQ